MAEDYPVKTIVPGVHVFGPHRERFWLGNYRPLKKRFAAVAGAMTDGSTSALVQARRFVEMIDLDREDFAKLSDADAPFWLVNMPVVELLPPSDGLLVYSPVPLDPQGRLRAALKALGPVRVVIAPHAFHTAGLASFREAYPEALFVCPKGSPLTGGKSLSELRPELGFHAVVEDEASIEKDTGLVNMLSKDFAIEVLNDAVLNEIVLYHRKSQILISADFVYKAAEFEAVPGLGGPEHGYIGPDWFAEAYQVLNLDPSPSKLLPDNRAFLAKQTIFDREGFLASVHRVLTWQLDWMICTHTDLLDGAKARDTILKSWQWLMDE
jgi:hypothetical protein